MAWKGLVDSIFLRGERGGALRRVDSVAAVPGRGLEGDRLFAAGPSASPLEPGREVTLIEREALEALESESGVRLGPGQSRRNIVTRGAPLNHLVGREFSVGPVRLQGVRLCEPCEHLESLTAPGVLRGLLHRGGLRARILTGGVIREGDEILP